MFKPFLAALLVAGALSALGGVWPLDDARGGQVDRVAEQDWPFYGGDQGGMKYSTLADVNAATVTRLGIAWEWAPREKALPAFGTRPGTFQTTPLMIDNVLYFSTPYNRVVALNADSGA